MADKCDKCKESINKLEPCFKVNYGFLNDDDSFYADEVYMLVHIECLSDAELLHAILESIRKN
tara:strand:+ start:235 stop:423 length:189 start_codon:yes stop_codon:yes gene_type:complete